jgi:hypothetical protein
MPANLQNVLASTSIAHVRSMVQGDKASSTNTEGATRGTLKFAKHSQSFCLEPFLTFGVWNSF